MELGHSISLLGLAPETGFEPATSKLTASCSTAELLRNIASFIKRSIIEGAYWIVSEYRR